MGERTSPKRSIWKSPSASPYNLGVGAMALGPYLETAEKKGLREERKEGGQRNWQKDVGGARPEIIL